MGGVQLGKYLISTRLARGGMAEIFLATSHGPEGFAKHVVIKRLLPHLAQRPEIVSMFLDEARLAASLHHPHIVQIFDLGEEGQDLYLSMEYLAGRDLSAILHRAGELGATLPLEVVAQIASCVAQGLQYAHCHQTANGASREIVHGDVSPSNVVVTFVGEVKVVDFGIARPSGAVQQAFPGAIQGKLAYLAPEQIAHGRTDRRADLWALGVVMHELFTGRRLFRRDGDEATRRAVLDEPIPDPSALRPEMPRRLSSIVMRCLERDPERRVQSAEEVRLALEAFLADSTWVPTSARLSGFMSELFGEDQAQQAMRGPAPEPTGPMTVAEPGLSPALSLAVPLLPDKRTQCRRNFVRVVGEVPAALVKAGHEIVAAPANLVQFAMRWTPRKVMALAASLLLVGFLAGAGVRDVAAWVGVEGLEGSFPVANALARAIERVGHGARAAASALEQARQRPPPEAQAEDAPPVSLRFAQHAQPEDASPRTVRVKRMRQGRLVLQGRGVVYVGGRRLGPAPLTQELPAGSYEVALVGDGGEVRRTWIAVVRSGRTTQLVETTGQ